MDDPLHLYENVAILIHTKLYDNKTINSKFLRRGLNTSFDEFYLIIPWDVVC